MMMMMVYSYIIHIQLYTETLKHNDERTHFFIKKYTSHTLFSKGLRKGWCWLCVRGELETGTDCNILTQSSSVLWQHVFLILLSWSTGVLRAQALFLSLRRLVPNCDWNSNCDCNSNWTLPASNSNCLKPSVTPGYVIVWHSPAFCGCHVCAGFNPSTGQGDIPISSTGCTCFLINGSVEGQYVTII